MAKTGNGLRAASNPTDLNNYWSFLAFTTWKPSSFQTCNAQDSEALQSPSPVMKSISFHLKLSPHKHNQTWHWSGFWFQTFHRQFPILFNLLGPSGKSKPWNMENFSLRKPLSLHISDQRHFSSLCQKENNIRIEILLFRPLACYLLHE